MAQLSNGLRSEWVARTTADPTLVPSIGVASNRDAHDIGVAVRQKLQEAGRVGPDQVSVPVLLRGEPGIHQLPLGEGDRVRVFHRVLNDRVHFASNGDVLTVLNAGKDGLRARNDAGTVGFIRWGQLTGRHDPAPTLAYGHALTIDASQGNTSRIHMDVILSGSWLHQGGKGYVNESRQTETTLMFVNEATERRKISSQMPRGEVIRLQPADIWRHVAGNMDRQTTKATASDFMKAGTNIYRGTTTVLPTALAPAERREKAGEGRMTLRWRLDAMAAHMAPAFQQAMQKTLHVARERTRDIGRGMGLSR